MAGDATEFYLPTFTGRKFDPFADPIDPDTIHIVDMAHSLAQQVRYAGHLNRHYDVAEHSYRVHRLAPAKVAAKGLMHDGSEAYLLDMPRGIKHHPCMEGYRQAHVVIQTAIYKKYGIPDRNTPEEIHLFEIDRCIPIAEAVHAKMYDHPSILCRLNGEDEGGSMMAQWAYKMSTAQEGEWGWDSLKSEYMFLSAARFLLVMSTQENQDLRDRMNAITALRSTI